MKLGNLIHQYRKENALTMAEFAKRAELSKGYISMLEKDKNPKTQRGIIPTFSTLQAIAKAMNINVNDLINFLDTNQPISLDENKDVFCSDDVKKLVNDYNLLNASGKEKATDYVSDLTTMEKYKK